MIGIGTCAGHTDKDARYLCMKHNIHMCDACRKCRDPELYCKFRPSCPISFMDKKGVEGWGENIATVRKNWRNNETQEN